ncbi:MAG: hypothetical protein JSS63_05385 [Bacteroidetes bacterium]|nr:hypothetical protein [Bacteroidota bacterium]
MNKHTGNKSFFDFLEKFFWFLWDMDSFGLTRAVQNTSEENQNSGDKSFRIKVRLLLLIIVIIVVVIIFVAR